MDSAQQLLLKAILQEDFEAYSAWKKRVDINELNPGEMRLLPLLSERLSRRHVEDELSDKLRGLRKRTWLYNQHLFQQTRHLFGEHILLKGAAIALSIYDDLSLRPMDDIDLLVPIQEMQRAVSLLSQHGFIPMISNVDFHTYFRFRHSLGFKNSKGVIVDLHASILEECCGDGESHPFYNHCVNVKGFNVLEPTELLFHTLVHGSRWNPTSPVRWVADAVAILEKKEVEWERLLEYGRKYQLLSPLKESLSLLTQFTSRIPPLDYGHVSRTDSFEYAFHLSSYNGIVPSVKHHWNHYQKCARGRWGFLQFCKGYWGVKSSTEFASEGIRKIAKKLQLGS